LQKHPWTSIRRFQTIETDAARILYIKGQANLVVETEKK
jgi:hypothetical protein